MASGGSGLVFLGDQTGYSPRQESVPVTLLKVKIGPDSVNGVVDRSKANGVGDGLKNAETLGDEGRIGCAQPFDDATPGHGEVCCGLLEETRSNCWLQRPNKHTQLPDKLSIADHLPKLDERMHHVGYSLGFRMKSLRPLNKFSNPSHGKKRGELGLRIDSEEPSEAVEIEDVVTLRPRSELQGGDEVQKPRPSDVGRREDNAHSPELSRCGPVGSE